MEQNATRLKYSQDDDNVYKGYVLDYFQWNTLYIFTFLDFS